MHYVLTMLRNLIGSISLLLLMVMTNVAQVREREPSMTERARQLEPFIVESAKLYGIDPRVLRTVCFLESRFRVGAVSPKGALGPMQFMPETAARYGVRDPHDPRQAIAAGARYLRDLLIRFGGRVDLALAAYNAGEGAVQSFMTGHPLILRSGKIINARRTVTGGIPPYPETINYVRSAGALLGGHLVNGQTSSAKSADQNVHKTSPSRDFTIDVVGETDQPTIKLATKQGSSFIDIP